MEKSIFEQMGGTYEMEGDYRLPCLALPAEEKPVGIWGTAAPTVHQAAPQGPLHCPVDGRQAE